MSKKSFIESIKVEKPCSQDWDTMHGNDQVRFCDHCSKNVNDLSTITVKQARKLVLRSGGDLCVRYRYEKGKGVPIFGPQVAKLARRTGAAAGVLGASIMLTTPAVYAQGSPMVQVIRADKVDGRQAGVSGVVTDSNGAVIPAAVVSLINQENGETFFQNSATDGKYEFKQLPAGTYKLKIEAGGFQSKETTVEVLDGSDIRTHLSLDVQGVSEVVQVGGDSEVGYAILGGAMMTITSSEKPNPLVQAVLADNIDEVRELLLKKPKVNVRDKSEDGMSPLHAAVENGNVEIATLLLSYGAKIDSKDNLKRTPIMMLDDDASPELLDLLVSYGARFDLRDKRKNGVLHQAAQNGVSDELFLRLLALSPDVNAVNKDGKTALLLAAEEDNEDLVKLLIGHGANINIRDREKRSGADLTSSSVIREMFGVYEQAKN